MRPEESISQRVAKGGVWVFTMRVLEKGISLLRLVILARLLSPDDFGLFGIALLALSILETFSQTGLHTALVQKKGNVAQYLDTAWTIFLIRGTILFIILFFSAPYVALFFNRAEVSIIIKAIGVSLFLGGITNIGIIFFQKELQFNKQFIFRFSITLADAIVVILSAVVFRNVWALVLGMLAGSLTGLVVSYVINPYRPHFRLDLNKAKELFGFIKWIFGSSILVFFITQGDDAFVGKFLGATMLGFYQMAYKISNMPTSEITDVISQVTFPAYSKIQDNLPRLREAYLRVLQLTAFLSFPIAGLIFVLASDFTNIILGVKWTPMIPALQVLVLWGLIRSIGTATGQIFVSIGRPGIVTRLQFIALILLSIFIYPLSLTWGILGTSLAVVFSILLPNFVAFYLIIRILKIKTPNFIKILSFPFICTILTILLILLLKTYSTNFYIFELCLAVVLGLTFYVCVTFLIDKLYKYGLYKNLIMNFNLIKR